MDRGGSLGENQLWCISVQTAQTGYFPGDGSLGLAVRYPENRVPVIVSAECVSGAIPNQPSTWRLRVTDPDEPSGNNPFVPWQFQCEWYFDGWSVDINPSLTSDTTQAAAWTYDAASRTWTWMPCTG